MSRSRNSLYFEDIGEDFDSFMSDYDVSRRIELIDGMMPDSAAQLSCLEVGCGTGRISEYLYPRVNALTVLDISSRLASAVAERLEVRPLAGDACHLPLADATFDLVISSECIEHTEQPLRAVAEMARVVKHGGFVIITTPNKLWYPLLAIARLSRIRKFRGPENWNFPGAVADTLSRHGMSVREISGCHLVPWQVPLAKRLLPFFDSFGRQLYPLMINFGILAQKLYPPK